MLHSRNFGAREPDDAPMSAEIEEAPAYARFEGSTVELARETDAGPWSVEVGSPACSESFPLTCDARLTLGSGADADVRIDDRTVSAKHARIDATPRGVRVEDLQSKNGVYVGGARVQTAWL